MPAKKPTKSSLDTRKALLEALRAIRAARKSIGIIGKTADPVKYPPQSTNTVCRLSISKVAPSYPPHVPDFICKLLRFPPQRPTTICHLPPVPKGATKEDFALGLYVVEFWLRFLVNVHIRLFPPVRPTRPKPKSRS
jgi:hypothetical protein